jgi:hypothetical protein
VLPELPAHTADEPVMLPGVAGTGDTFTDRLPGELVPQLLFAVTLTFPDKLPKFTIMEVVPCPPVIEAPAGTVHV